MFTLDIDNSALALEQQLSVGNVTFAEQVVKLGFIKEEKLYVCFFRSDVLIKIASAVVQHTLRTERETKFASAVAH